VVFRSIEIHDDGEATKGEWDLEISVNGRVKTWHKGGVRVQTYNLDKEFKLTDCNTPITISVSGWEIDSGSSSGGFWDYVEDNNDKLSDFSASYPAPNADSSVLRSYNQRTSNATGDYTIHYEIVRTCKQVSTISSKDMIASIKAQAKESGRQLKAKNDSEVLNYALRKLQRSGWRVVGTIEDKLLIEGFPPILKRGRPAKVSEQE
jgi:hypothetical protein